MQNELKPCPFCGGKAILWENCHAPQDRRYTISCNNCACELFKGRATNKEAIFNEWNNRQPVVNWKPIDSFVIEDNINKNILLVAKKSNYFMHRLPPKTWIWMD